MKKIILVFLAGMLIASCQSKAVTGETVSAASGSYTNITPGELNKLLNNKDFVLVNVHIPFAGDIPGTDLSIPYNQIEQNISQLPADKTAKIVLYCSSGRMSQIAAEDLVTRGYTNIWNLNGGMVDWENEGFEIQK